IGETTWRSKTFSKSVLPMRTSPSLIGWQFAEHITVPLRSPYWYPKKEPTTTCRGGHQSTICYDGSGKVPMAQMQDIHQKLRELILSLDLGPGERLSERWLEAKFGGSRTPVRAALIRLEAEGLVQREGRNWTVSPIDLREIEALYEFREPVEAAAIRLVCRRADAGDLDALEALLDSCDAGAPREEWHRIGTEFHVGLARLSGNPFILK